MQESYFTSTCRICFNKDNIMINMLDKTEFDKTVLELSEKCGDVEVSYRKIKTFKIRFLHPLHCFVSTLKLLFLF